MARPAVDPGHPKTQQVGRHVVERGRPSWHGTLQVFFFLGSSMRNARSDVDDHLRSDAQSKPVTTQLARLLVLLCVDCAVVLGLS